FTSRTHTLSLHDALPIYPNRAIIGDRDDGIERLPVQRRDIQRRLVDPNRGGPGKAAIGRHGKRDVVILKIAEATVLPNCVEIAEIGRHTSELQSPYDLVC